MPSKKLPLLLLIIISALSLLRLLKITTKTSPSAPPPPPPPPLQLCSSPISTCIKLPLHVSKALVHYATSPIPSTLTPKELRLLLNLISQRAPCNLLVFGFEPQSFLLSTLNANGTTVFLEDSPEKLAHLSNSNLQGLNTFNVDHRMTVNESYRLLRHARMDPACAPHTGALRESGCPLALTWLPDVVYKEDWDVVVVDGPSGDGLEAPGRMGAIYSAAMMARTGKITDVFIHDVDRTVEWWYSWEFLCEENLVASKGKLWHFRIIGNGNTTGFCSRTTFRVE